MNKSLRDTWIYQGRKAFHEKKTPDDNPYKLRDWRHVDWQQGWDEEEQSYPDLFDWRNNRFKT